MRSSSSKGAFAALEKCTILVPLAYLTVISVVPYDMDNLFHTQKDMLDKCFID